MKSNQITIKKNTRRLKLTFIQALTHYGVAFFFMIIVLFTGWSFIEIYVTHTYSGLRSANELLIVTLPFLTLAIIFSIIQYRRLGFKEINIVYSEEHFQKAVLRTVNELKWSIEKNNKTFFRAVRPGNWTMSWGEMVTIIKEKDCLLINSICDPGNMSSFASFGWNGKNVKTFIRHLSDVINNNPEVITEEREINAGSFKNRAFRVFAYPFCICLFVFGVFMILEPLTIKTVAAGLGAIIIAAIYLYTDIKVLTRKYYKKGGHDC